MLDASKVHAVLMDCLFKDEELTHEVMPKDGVLVEGVMHKIGLHKERLESHKEEIRGFLSELPDNFRESVGGGWTFLNACIDREGNQWGEHVNVDELLMLGQAVGLAKYSMPREMWDVLPGGMPYFSVSIGA